VPGNPKKPIGAQYRPHEREVRERNDNQRKKSVPTSDSQRKVGQQPSGHRSDRRNLAVKDKKRKKKEQVPEIEGVEKKPKLHPWTVLATRYRFLHKWEIRALKGGKARHN